MGSAVSSVGSGPAEVVRNGDGEYRSPNFYKERREMTRSPLGPDASVKEMRIVVTGVLRFCWNQKQKKSQGGSRPDSGKGGGVQSLVWVFVFMKRKQTSFISGQK